MSFHPGIGVLAVALLVSASAGAAFAGAPYHLTDLGNLGSNYPSITPMGVSNVNGSAEVVGIAQTSGALDAAAWYWTAATGMVNLQPQLSSVLSSVDSEATAVNANGQIIGSYNNVYDSQTPGTTEGNGFVYTIGGTPVQMGAPTNTNPVGTLPNNFWITAPTGINSSGLACGSGGVGINPEPMVFSYNVNSSDFTDVSLNSSVNAYGYAINNNGWIAGWGPNLTTGVGQDALVWNGTSWTDLGSFAGKPTYARGIDSNGDVVGFSPNASNARMPFYCQYNGTGWNAMVNLGVAAGETTGQAWGINDNGQIVGYETGSATAAYLWSTTAGSGVPLSSLVANLNGWTLQSARAIDNQGDIVGVGTNPSGAAETFLLTLMPGDANLDGQVDINDLTIVLANYNQTGRTWSQGEFTGSGTVDINDLTIVLANYNHTVSESADGSPSAVPEPGALALLAAGVAGLLAYTWRRRK